MTDRQDRFPADRFPEVVDRELARQLKVSPRALPRDWGERPVKDIRQVVRQAQVNPNDAPEKQRADLVTFYKRHLLVRGLKMVNSGLTLDAYVNRGRWVARCIHCNGGIPVWPEWDQGCCPDCGVVYKIKFPTTKQMADAEVELAKRPNPENRNWFPKDETAKTLRDENAARGIE